MTEREWGLLFHLVGVILLFAAMTGAAGGERPKRARKLAVRWADDTDEVTDELRALLDDRLSLALDYASALAVVAALVLMVWKP